MEQLRVLVVGAGLAGLALARSLRQAGFATEVIDRAAAWEVAGTGIYLPANGARALRALGLEQAVAGRGASGCSTGAGGCWSTWTCTGSGDGSARAWRCTGPICTP
jgi:predicted oxidoreductase